MKLYSQDEYSPFICTSCCNNLCDSYTFMLRVRKAEQDLRLGNINESKQTLSTEEESLKFEKKSSESSITINEQEDISDPQDPQDPQDLQDPSEEEAFVEIYEKEEIEIGFEGIEEKLIEAVEAPYEFVELNSDQEPLYKKQKKNPTPKLQMPVSITYTHYELVAYKENDQNVITLNTYPALMELPKIGKYTFDTSWIQHKPKEPTIFKCKLCVKAFSNVEFLLKHNLSCHYCLICSQMLDGYKDLTQHSKEHSSVVCHFCGKNCGSSSNFRQHLKKQHFLEFPSHIGILNDQDSIIIE